MRTAVVERGPFVRDVAATGHVVAAVSPTLFAEAPGTIIYKVRAGDTVKAGDVLGTVDSAALTNEYERERATLASTEAALNRQTIEVRRQILKSSQDSDLAKVQITAAEREFKRAEDAWGIHVIPRARLPARARRSRNREAQLRARHRNRRPREGQPAARAAQPARSRATPGAAGGAPARTRGCADAQVSGGRHGGDARAAGTRAGGGERAAGHRGRPLRARDRIPGGRDATRARSGPA